MTKVTATVIKRSNKTSNILTISLLNFDADNVPVFLRWSAGQEVQRKRKGCLFSSDL